MRKLDGPLRTGGGTHTATLTYGFDNLRLLLAAEFHFRDGAEGAATDALAAGHTALVVHLRDLRVIFKFVAGKERQHLGRSGRAGAGLKYTYADSQYSDTVPAGNVISQTKSGETVAAGTTITLTLSKGKQEISTNVSKGISYSGEGTVVKAEYKLVGKSGTVYDKGSYENTSSFTVSGTMKEATGSIVVTWTVQTGETDEAGNPATVTLDPVTYSVP